MNWTGEDVHRSPTDATALLVGPVLGGLLPLWGILSLHGSVVALPGGAVAIIAPEGLGKSTLAAAMARFGHPVLSDDVAAISEKFPGAWRAEPGYPRLRLGMAPAAFIADQAIDAGPVFTGSDRRYIGLRDDHDARAWSFCSQPVRVAAIYELRRSSELGSPAITPIRGAARAATLARHLRTPVVPPHRRIRANEMQRLARLADSIPIRTLAIPEGLDRLRQACWLLERMHRGAETVETGIDGIHAG
jgi:hypothetical protein